MITAKHLQYLIIVLFIFLVLSSSLLTPTFEAPDENAHYYYIQYLWRNRTLPVLTKDVAALSDPRYQSYQPPGYYLVALMFAAFAPNELSQPLNLSLNPYFSQELNTLNNDNKNRYLHTSDDEFPFRNVPRAVHIARLASVALAALNALALLYFARTIFESDAHTLIFLTLTLFVPGHVFIGGMINTDNSVILMGTLIALLSWRLVDRPDSRRTWIALALVISYTTLSKVTTISLIPAVIIVSAIAFSRSKDRRGVIINILLMGVIWFVLTSWMFVRNYNLYGDPTGVQRIYEVTGEYGIFSLDRLLSTLPWIWQTFIGRLATQNFPMPEVVYNFFAALMLAGVFGWLWHLPRTEKILNWIVLLVAIAGLLTAVFYNAAVNTSGAQGRYLYPVLGAVMAIVVKGLLTLTPTRFHRALTYSLLAVMSSLSAVAIFVWLPAAYKLPTRFTTFTPPPNFQPLNYQIGESIKLHGITVSSSRLTASDTLTVTLYWEALKPVEANHSVFLQVVDSQSNKVAQKQTLSGLGMYQPTRWQLGEIIADEIPLTIDAKENLPSVYSIIGGMLDEKTGERLPMTRNDYNLGEVLITPKQMPVELPKDAQTFTAQFDNGVELRGCRVRASTMTLYWFANKSVAEDYKIFVHLWDTAKFFAGLDHSPMNGRFPTRFWQRGDWIEDEVTLTDRERIARVLVGFYNADSQLRLPLIRPESADYSYTLPKACWNS